jgi:hypothetical protein
MANLISAQPFRKPVSAIERLSDHIRAPRLSWPARRLVRRFGMRAATAQVIAELVGYTTEAR